MGAPQTLLHTSEQWAKCVLQMAITLQLSLLVKARLRSHPVPSAPPLMLLSERTHNIWVSFQLGFLRDCKLYMC